jgi:hypothetical protein
MTMLPLFFSSFVTLGDNLSSPFIPFNDLKGSGEIESCVTVIIQRCLLKNI